MSHICPHTGEPTQPLADAFPRFAGVAGSDEYRVSQTGVIYYTAAKSVDYGPDYFLDEYKNQYGKSYLDDESNLRRLASSRLSWLQNCIGEFGDGVDWKDPAGPRMLEIGSAAGFFLDEAREFGWNPRGLEISPFASDFALQRGHSIITKSFLELEPSDLHREANAPGRNSQLIDEDHYALPGRSGLPALFDALAVFYTVEHFRNQSDAFQRMADLLRPGGWLILALPSSHGPLFQCSPAQWIQSHPTDHFADYSPQSLSLVLEQYDLELLASRPASYHQKRACGWLRYAPPFLYRRHANRTSYGDTMEIVARKRQTS